MVGRQNFSRENIPSASSGREAWLETEDASQALLGPLGRRWAWHGVITPPQPMPAAVTLRPDSREAAAFSLVALVCYISVEKVWFSYRKLKRFSGFIYSNILLENNFLGQS